MLIKEYLIQELEKTVGVSVRNIRYYTGQKLLLPPMYRGKQAIYTSDHVKRLQVIKRLRDRHFSLEEIRGLLLQMDETDMDRLVVYQDQIMKQATLPAPSENSPSSVDQKSPSEAIEYIESLLSNQNIRVAGKGESWERISLDNGIELHIRQPVDPTDVEKIQKLVDTARDLFRKRKRGG